LEIGFLHEGTVLTRSAMTTYSAYMILSVVTLLIHSESMNWSRWFKTVPTGLEHGISQLSIEF